MFAPAPRPRSTATAHGGHGVTHATPVAAAAAALRRGPPRLSAAGGGVPRAGARDGLGAGGRLGGALGGTGAALRGEVFEGFPWQSRAFRTSWKGF